MLFCAKIKKNNIQPSKYNVFFSIIFTNDTFGIKIKYISDKILLKTTFFLSKKVFFKWENGIFNYFCLAEQKQT